MATDKSEMQESKEAAKQTGMDPWVGGAAASVALSWYYFFVKGDREMGLFVGLWPPTLLAFGSFFRSARIESMLQNKSSGVAGQLQRFLKEQQ